jgi:hypothetical protein
VFDNFTTDAEALALLSHVTKWEASTDTGLLN